MADVKIPEYNIPLITVIDDNDSVRIVLQNNASKSIKKSDFLIGMAKLTDLVNFVTDSDLSTILTGYVTDTDLTTTLSDYVTETELANELSGYLKTTDSKPFDNSVPDETSESNVNHVAVMTSNGGEKVAYATFKSWMATVTPLSNFDFAYVQTSGSLLRRGTANEVIRLKAKGRKTFSQDATANIDITFYKAYMNITKLDPNTGDMLFCGRVAIATSTFSIGPAYTFITGFGASPDFPLNTTYIDINNYGVELKTGDTFKIDVYVELKINATPVDWENHIQTVSLYLDSTGPALSFGVGNCNLQFMYDKKYPNP